MTAPTLHLTQTVKDTDTFLHIAMALTGAGLPLAASADFIFTLSEQERQNTPHLRGTLEQAAR